MALSWEIIDTIRHVERAKVRGGWLVLIRTMQMVEAEMPVKSKVLGAGSHTELKRMPLNGLLGFCFVADKKHEWQIEKEPETMPPPSLVK